jgi:hypothetical protein
MRFDVIAAVSVHIMVFWDVTLCNLAVSISALKLGRLGTAPRYIFECRGVTATLILKTLI